MPALSANTLNMLTGPGYSSSSALSPGASLQLSQAAQAAQAVHAQAVHAQAAHAQAAHAQAAQAVQAVQASLANQMQQLQYMQVRLPNLSITHWNACISLHVSSFYYIIPLSQLISCQQLPVCILRLTAFLSLKISCWYTVLFHHLAGLSAEQCQWARSPA